MHIASLLSGTDIAFRDFDSSGWTHAIRRSISTASHDRPVTLLRRSPVHKVKAAMSARCSGNSEIRRRASSLLIQRTRLVGSLNNRTRGIFSIHSQSSRAARRIDRMRARYRLAVAAVVFACLSAIATAIRSRLTSSR